jgi:uncharacterized membrane protein
MVAEPATPAPDRKPADDGSAGGGRRPHRIVVPVLVGLGLVCIFVSTLSVWLRDSALDSGVWESQSTQLLQSENVRTLLATYVADQVVTQTDAQQLLASTLPPRLQPLAGAGTAALGRLADQAVQDALTLPRVQDLWAQANLQAHQKLVAFLKGETTRLQSSNGNVVLNVDQLVANMGARLGASPDAVAKVQGHVEPIVLVRSNQLGLAQTGVQAVEVLSIWPLLIGVVLIGLAVYLARDRRRTVVRDAAIGFIVIGVVLLVVRKFLGDVVIDSLVKADSVKPAAHDVWDIYTNLLRESAVAGIAIGILGLVWSWVSGPATAATSLRRRLAPGFRDHPVRAYTVLALVALLVALYQPPGTPRRTIGLVLLVIVAFAGLEAVRRQSVSENPDATDGLWAGIRGFRGGRSAAGGGQADAGARLEQLERLTALHERGGLTDAEYEREKALMLSH